jgi:hypothetical protein
MCIQFVIGYLVALVILILNCKMYKERVTGLDLLIVSLASLFNWFAAVLGFLVFIIGLIDGRAVNLPFGKSISKALNKEIL